PSRWVWCAPDARAGDGRNSARTERVHMRRLREPGTVRDLRRGCARTTSRKESAMKRHGLLIGALLAVLVGLAYGAVQLKPTKVLLVKNPPGKPQSRTVAWKVNEKLSSNTVVGNPMTDGAKLRVQLTPGGDQCVSMPASGWTAISTLGFKYK